MTATEATQQHAHAKNFSPARPRLGFLGLGWIGLHRLRAVVQAEVAAVHAVADPDTAARSAALQSAPGARQAASLDELLNMDLDGIVLATPSGMHAEQALQALQHKVPVFCQKPLARSAAETARVVEAAEAADRLLHVDFSYRHVRGVQQAKQRIQAGAIGEVFLVDLCFHNAYGPDKAWFYDRARSGGGCVVDLGTHLIDLCQWMLATEDLHHVRSTLWQNGQPYQTDGEGVEDAAIAQWQTPLGCQVRLACSWNLHAGTPAVIEAKFYGTQGAVVLRNLNGSFYDLLVEHHTRTQATPLAELDADWGGRALVQWARQVGRDHGFDPQVKQTLAVAKRIDEVYGR